jgi:hypothetical protein
MRRSAPLPPRVSLALLTLALILLVVLAWWLVSPNAGLVTAAIAAFAVLMAASVLVLPARLVARDANGAVLEGEQRANAVNSAPSTLVQGLVGLAALAGIFVAWQQFQTDREQSRSDRQQLTEQLTLTRQSQVAERFTRAIEQLGSDQLEQRLGGASTAWSESLRSPPVPAFKSSRCSLPTSASTLPDPGSLSSPQFG